jgi:hypothetical protein
MTMRYLFSFVLALILASLVPCWREAEAATPLKELVRKADLVLRGKSSAGVFTMEIKTSSFRRSFKIVMWDSSIGKERTLIKILGPALWRGHGTLKVGSHLKIFNPRSNHVTVVSHSMLGDSWMGSHFTNDDLVKETRLARHYHSKLLKSKKGAVDGKPVTYHDILLKPKPTAPVAWGKMIYSVWERGDLVMPVKAEYYRKASQKRPDRTMTFSHFKKMGGRLVPARMEMTVAKKPGEHTRITYKSVKFDIRIPDNKFTEQALRR